MKEVSIPIPEQIGPYAVVRPLAQGGMAAVFEVEDPNTREHLALKLLTHRGLAMPRFSREFRALTRLDHPNIVRVYRYGANEDGSPYLTMELLDGVPVQVHAKATGRPGDPRRTREVLRIVALVADALEYLHARGIVHRDLKSANILVLSDKRVKLLDFGTARLTGKVARITRAGEFVGTFAYASPEQIRGDEVDHRSDIYSLGALFYRLSTGKRLFEAPTPHELARMHLEKAPIPPRALVPALPADVEALILEMLAKDPDERPQSAAEVAARLRGRPGATPARDRVVISKPKRLIGRSAELQAIRAALGRARPGRMVLIVGPPGSGRRRLLKAAIAEARGQGWRVFGGTFTGDPGLGVLVDVVEAAWSSLPPDDLVALEGEVSALRAGGAVAPDLPPGEALPAEVEVALCASITRVLVRRCGLDDAPLVVGLSQLQRASPMALSALARVRTLLKDEGASVIFLGCSTDDSDAPGASIRQQLPDAWRLNLKPLRLEEVDELIRGMLGGTLSSPEISRTVHKLTGGWPGYVEDVLRAMVQEGHLEARRTGSSITWVDRSSGRITIPGGAREALTLRLDGLSRPCTRALEALAVSGGEATVALIARAIDRSEDDTLELLEELATARVLRCREEGGRELWSFRLGMTRDLVLERLRPSRRHVLRRLMARAVADAPVSANKIHLLASAGRVDAAIADLLRWAEPMIESGRAPEALPVLEEVQVVSDAARTTTRSELARFYLLLGRALAAVRPGGQAVDEAFHRAHALADGDPVMRGEVDLYLARLQMARGELESGAARLHRAFEALAGGKDRRLGARVSRDVGHLQWLSGRFELAEHWFEQALDAARAAGGDPDIARALVAGGMALLDRGQLVEAERRFREALQRFDGVGDQDGLWQARAALSSALRHRGRLSEAIELLEGDLRAARESGTLSRYAQMSLRVAEAEIELLRLGQARERLAALTAELDPRQHLFLCAAVALAQGRVALISGEHDRANDVLKPALKRSERAGLHAIAPRIKAALGEACAARGQEDLALNLLESATQRLREAGHLTALGEACAARARAFRGREDPDRVFAPVREWMDAEPALLCRMEYLVSCLIHARARGRTDRETAYGQAARRLLQDITSGLSPSDQEALAVHPWAIEVGPE
ncbi:MAG: protein kinase [Alphaproteobacteria bacterium]|nr:protein kinase [Alphaproteobacteria bacterium]